MVIGLDILTDITYIVRFCSIPIFLYLILKTSKKIKEAKFSYASFGFTLLLLCFMNFLISFFVVFFYFDTITSRNVMLYYADPILIIGLILFIFFTEYDLSQSNRDTIFKRYPLTLFSILISLVLIPVDVINIFLIIITIGIVFIPFCIVMIKFISKFKNLELVKRERPLQLFILGILLTGIGNLLVNEFITNTFGLTPTFLISGLLTIIGGILLARTMYKLPALSELDWINKLERLYVIRIDNSLLIFHYNFQASRKDQFEIDEKSAMEGSALAGINMLLKEILESESPIKQIDYSEKKLCFNQGKKTISILIASSASNEFNYRLEMFHLSFEKRYQEALNNWDGEISQFYKADEIVKEYFL